ncbi:hypothetical protein EI94DRAFT_1588841, partial [Lactarius quietus]
PIVNSPSSGLVSSKMGRRISKDMVSKPMGFVHLVHTSVADQTEALLTRWGAHGHGIIVSPTRKYFDSFNTWLHSDPRWAILIKARIRQAKQARTINGVVSALKPEQYQTVNGEDAPSCVPEYEPTPLLSENIPPLPEPESPHTIPGNIGEGRFG